jgi:membrane-associated phospholipid phosphatase
LRQEPVGLSDEAKRVAGAAAAPEPHVPVKSDLTSADDPAPVAGVDGDSPHTRISALRSHPRLLLFGTVGYLTLIVGVMLWRGVEIEPQWVLLSLLLVAVLLGRARQFVQDWVPYLILFLAYEEMRGFAGATGFAPHDLAGMERALFAGQIPTIWLQQRFYNPNVIGIQDWVLMFTYFLHFPLPILVGFLFWLRDRGHYWRYVSALLLTSFLSFVIYLFWPSAPPWYEFANHGVVKIINETVTKWGVGYYVSPIYHSLNPNKFAAFPSLHAAYPALGAIFAWRRYPWLAAGLVAWTALVWYGIVYLGEHYVVDALAGLALALAATAAVAWLAPRLGAWWAGRSAARPATPPRPSA